ncbi:MAG: hypothetical protein ACKOVI_01805 [Candidatus Planktophila sp.]
MRNTIARTALSGVLLISIGLSGLQSASAVDEVAVDPATLVFEITPVATATGTTLIMDFPDSYWTRLIILQVGTTKNGLTTYKGWDHFALWKEDGKVTISYAKKLIKGQKLRVRMGGRYVKTMTIQ